SPLRRRAASASSAAGPDRPRAGRAGRRPGAGGALAALGGPADDGVHGRQPGRLDPAVGAGRAHLPQLPGRGDRARGRRAPLPRGCLRVGRAVGARAGAPARRGGPVGVDDPAADGQEPVPQPGAQRLAQGARGPAVDGARRLRRRPPDARAVRQLRAVRPDALRRVRGRLVLLRLPAGGAVRRRGSAAGRAAALPRARPARARRRDGLRGGGRPGLAVPLARDQRAEPGARPPRPARLPAGRGRRHRGARLRAGALGRRLHDRSRGGHRADRRGGHRL
ncbi:MAG: hypothetical protein AVDCRST_MAG52-1638, partial [uncultured Blastococcus sp.]